MPPPQKGNNNGNADFDTGAMISPTGRKNVPILAEEPVFYAYPTTSPHNSSGSFGPKLLPTIAPLPYPYPPSATYYKPYGNHQMVIIY